MDIFHGGNSSQQLAEQLESDIRNGGYPPGGKLLSIRSLGQRYGVDRNIISVALNLLELRGVVRKEARKGVFVNPGALAGSMHELYIFIYCSESSGQTSYTELALQLHRRFDYRRRFNVTLRCAGWGELDDDAVRSEVERAKRNRSHVIIFSGDQVNAERIAILRSGEIPFLIVGETGQNLSDLEFNQVYASCATKGIDVGNFIENSKYQRIAYFALPENMMEFEEDYIRMLREYTERAGKRFILKRLNFKGIEETGPRQYEIAVRELLASGERPDLLHFADLVDVRAVARLAGEFNLRLPDDVNILGYSYVMKNPVPGIWVAKADFDSFADEVFNICERLATGGGHVGKCNLTHLVSHRIMELNLATFQELFS